MSLKDGKSRAGFPATTVKGVTAAVSRPQSPATRSAPF
ncbi:hypothetical protein I547_4360 [Mycobacterium kansasii 824]|nr:hypothetical protein I547_4360 [Mycobacterium kansasii 824]